jgi:hypothetical protein
MARTRRDGVSRFDGVIGTADVALLSFSIVGQVDGDGIKIEGKRRRFGNPAICLTEPEAWRGTSASSSVTSYRESKSLSVWLVRLDCEYVADW